MKYKHKTLPLEAKRDDEFMYLVTNTEADYAKNFRIPHQLIKEDSNREEIKDVEVCGNGMTIKGKGDGGVECVFRGHFKDMKSGMAFDHKLKALYQIREWHAKNDTQEQKKVGLYYDYIHNRFGIEHKNGNHNQPFMPYFSGTEKAEQCIKECKPELNILFDIKE